MDSKSFLKLLLLGELLFAFYCLNGISLSVSGDAVSSALIPWAILQDHTLFLDGYEEFMASQYSIVYFASQNNGHTVSYYPIITPLAALPFYLPGYIALKITGAQLVQDSPYFIPATLMSMRLASITITILAVIIFYLSLRKVTGEKWALVTSVALGLTTEYWSIGSMLLWEHEMSALLLSLILYVIIDDMQKPSRNSFLYIGLLTVLLLFNRPSDLPLAAPGIYYALKTPGLGKRHLLLIILFALPILLVTVYFTGSPIAGYMDKWSGFNIVAFSKKLTAQFFDPEHGLLIYTPIVLLSIPGVIGALKDPRWRSLTLVILFSLVVFTLIITCYSYTPGQCYGPRYYTEAMPLFFLYIGMLSPDIKKALWFSASFILLFAFSFIIQLYGVFIYR